MTTPVAYFTRVQASSGWQHILAAFARFAAPQPGWRALDAGCGPGALVRHLAGLGCRASGLDADAAMLAQARHAAPNLPVWAGDVRALPFSASAFELVSAVNVLFLLAEPLAGLRELARVCRPEGVVAVLNPSPRLSAAAAQAQADQAGLTGFDRESLINWGRIAEAHHRLGVEEWTSLFITAGLRPPEFAEKIGPGLALLARSSPVQVQ